MVHFFFNSWHFQIFREGWGGEALASLLRAPMIYFFYWITFVPILLNRIFSCQSVNKVSKATSSLRGTTWITGSEKDTRSYYFSLILPSVKCLLPRSSIALLPSQTWNCVMVSGSTAVIQPWSVNIDHFLSTCVWEIYSVAMGKWGTWSTLHHLLSEIRFGI